MLPAEVLWMALRRGGVPQEPMMIDLCAAPGGKAAHLAAVMKDRRLLLTNEIYAARSQALRRNLVIAGASHFVIQVEDRKPSMARVQRRHAKRS